MMHGHVIGDEVENETDAGPVERLAQPAKALLSAEFRVECVVVDDVVAMARAGARLQEGRGVEMAHAEGVQVRYERGGTIEAESRRELETVGRDRNRGRHHPSPMLQNTDQGASMSPAA